MGFIGEEGSKKRTRNLIIFFIVLIILVGIMYYQDRQKIDLFYLLFVVYTLIRYLLIKLCH